MLLVQAHLAELMVERVEDRHFVRTLHDLHAEICENERHLLGPALVPRRWIAFASPRNLAGLPHHLGRPRLQDRIGMIAHQLAAVADPGLRSRDDARPVYQRAGPRQRQFQAVQRGMIPRAGDIRNRTSGLSGGRRGGKRAQSHEQKEISLSVHASPSGACIKTTTGKHITFQKDTTARNGGVASETASPTGREPCTQMRQCFFGASSLLPLTH
jgi:hypothetical protein